MAGLFGQKKDKTFSVAACKKGSLSARTSYPGERAGLIKSFFLVKSLP